MTFILGLTGSIGMGKTTTAAMFAAAGIPVWDADATVHMLYGPNGAGTRAIGGLYPEVVDAIGVSRTHLRRIIAADPTALDKIQSLIHPLVAADRVHFLATQTSDIVLLDIPLLFETGADADCDAIVVVTAPPETQRARVLARADMTKAEFNLILSRQLPDAEKRSQADYIIDTTTLDGARKSVQNLLKELRENLTDA
jgi:dephospho-CoA kinase